MAVLDVDEGEPGVGGHQGGFDVAPGQVIEFVVAQDRRVGGAYTRVEERMGGERAECPGVLPAAGVDRDVVLLLETRTASTGCVREFIDGEHFPVARCVACAGPAAESDQSTARPVVGADCGVRRAGVRGLGEPYWSMPRSTLASVATAWPSSVLPAPQSCTAWLCMSSAWARLSASISWVFRALSILAM